MVTQRARRAVTIVSLSLFSKTVALILKAWEVKRRDERLLIDVPASDAQTVSSAA